MKFNIFPSASRKTINYEGAPAYTLSPEMELYTAVVTASLNDQFYEKESDRLKRIQDLIAKVNPEIVAKMAIYTREKMYLRSVPMVMAVEMAKHAKGTNLVAQTVTRVVQRADEISELLAYYTISNGRNGQKKLNKLSKQVQKGLAGAFNKFDEYQFAKYNRDGAVKLKDALFLVHPKAKDEAQQEVFNKIAKDGLATPYTWETELSALGQQPFASEKAKALAVRAKWEELVASKKLGYMALLRNLRNLLEAEVSASTMVAVCGQLTSEEAVRKSKQLPFRFLAAYRELKQVKSGLVPMVLDALEEAVRLSVVNMRGFDAETKVVIACDVSGSMQKPISAKSKVLYYDISLLMGMMLQSKCKNVTSGMFGDRWKTISMPTRNILANVDEFYKREGEVGYATNGHLVLEDLTRRGYVADKVMLFTDCQMWNNKGNSSMETAWKAYKKVAPKAKLYLFDLAGLGQTPLDVKTNDVYLIAGWSDKIFDVLAALEEGGNVLSQMEAIVVS